MYPFCVLVSEFRTQLIAYLCMAECLCLCVWRVLGAAAGGLRSIRSTLMIIIIFSGRAPTHLDTVMFQRRSDAFLSSHMMRVGGWRVATGGSGGSNTENHRKYVFEIRRARWARELSAEVHVYGLLNEFSCYCIIMDHRQMCMSPSFSNSYTLGRTSSGSLANAAARHALLMSVICPIYSELFGIQCILHHGMDGGTDDGDDYVEAIAIIHALI